MKYAFISMLMVLSVNIVQMSICKNPSFQALFIFIFTFFHRHNILQHFSTHKLTNFYLQSLYNNNVKILKKIVNLHWRSWQFLNQQEGFQYWCWWIQPCFHLQIYVKIYMRKLVKDYIKKLFTSKHKINVKVAALAKPLKLNCFIVLRLLRDL